MLWWGSRRFGPRPRELHATAACSAEIRLEGNMTGIRCLSGGAPRPPMHCPARRWLCCAALVVGACSPTASGDAERVVGRAAALEQASNAAISQRAAYERLESARIRSELTRLKDEINRAPDNSADGRKSALLQQFTTLRNTLRALEREQVPPPAPGASQGAHAPTPPRSAAAVAAYLKEVPKYDENNPDDVARLADLKRRMLGP